MVSLEVISSIIDTVLNNNGLTEKCGSRKEIEQKLSSMSTDEKFDALGDLLNGWEQEHYQSLVDKWERVEDKDGHVSEKFQAEIDKLKEALYQYEKRIITHEKSEMPDVDFDEYKEVDQDYINNYDEASGIELDQINAQDKSLMDYRDFEKNINGTRFFGDDYIDVNHYLIEGEDYFKNMSESDLHGNSVGYWVNRTKETIGGLDKLIDHSGGLVTDTVLYRGGKLPFELDVGMTGKFDTFSSTSYSKRVAEGFQKDGEYLIRILAPKGTKGLCSGGHDVYDGELSDSSHLGYASEHEYLLGRGQRYVVLEKDNKHEPWTATIVLI